MRNYHMEHLLLLLLFFHLAVHLNAFGDASASTIATLWGSYVNGSKDAPNSGTYSYCVLEAGKLSPKCAGNFKATNPIDVRMLGIAGGAYFACGLGYDSAVPFCWGLNKNFEDNTWYDISVPAQYQSVHYTSLAVGAFHVCGLRAIGGTVDCWGATQAPDSQKKFTSIAAGWGFSCGLSEVGKASCWGDYDEINNKTETPDVVLKAIYAGGHACGIDNDTGLAFCWGSNRDSQANATIGYHFSSMALGAYHSCGILKDSHKVLFWGNDTFSQVSDTPKDETFSTISAGDDYTCGVTQPRHVKCWGKKVNYTLTNTEVSQGNCKSSACGNEQYQLAQDAAQCPKQGDRICLPCPGPLGETGCNKEAALSPAPGPAPGHAPGSQRPLTPRFLKHGWLVLGVVLCGTLSVSAAAYVFWCRRKQATEPMSGQQDWHKLSSRVVAFDSLTLKEATNNYSSHMLIGNGSSGVVYKATLPDKTVVAIKKEAPSLKKLPDTFSKEIELLSRLHHTFLTNLVGFCEEDKLLVYKFMENGSLSDCLFDKPSLKLNLALRIQIAARAARALEYLHVYASPRIIHRDIKSQNILLDKDWNAHVSDFGFSTLGPGPEDTHMTTTTLVGTPGFLDPVYFQTMQLTSNSDVYSFGVVLMELLCQRKAIQAGILGAG